MTEKNLGLDVLTVVNGEVTVGTTTKVSNAQWNQTCLYQVVESAMEATERFGLKLVN